MPVATAKSILLDSYKIEKICTLEHPNKVVGFEILAKEQQLNWNNFDRLTLQRIGDIDAGLDGFVSINLTCESVISLSDELIQQASFMRPGLVIEWVESPCSQQDLKKVADSLIRWRKDFGIRISIDDIGKGQDGTERFLAVIPDFAKIEGNLLLQARESAAHRRAMKYLCRWCQEENVPTIIEWVETRADLEIAQECGGVYGQGYLFERNGIELIR